MKQCEVTAGTRAFVKIGGRLAPVTVERVIDRGGVRRLHYQCRTGDTGRRITCTAARLRASGPAPARPAPAAGIQPGDRVKYAARFLRAIGCQTGPACFVTGTVERLSQVCGCTLAAVAWDDPREAGDAVNVANLVRVEDMHLECVL